MIKPLFDNVVLKRERINKETASGIVLSTKEQDSEYAVVVAVGDGKLADGKTVEMPVKVGDKVFFKSYSATKFKDDNEEYLIISLSNIMGICC